MILITVPTYNVVPAQLKVKWLKINLQMGHFFKLQSLTDPEFNQYTREIANVLAFQDLAQVQEEPPLVDYHADFQLFQPVD